MRIPILNLGRILLVSIQVDLTDSDAMEFQSDLVNRVAEIEALGVAIDITALDVVDSYMARVINDTAYMVRLLGAEAVICGVQPFVAMTLIEMGRDLLGANCAFNLEQGMEILQERIAKRGDAYLDEDENE
ncbi:Sulfate transporter/antisigma-factor antagonist STAS [Thiorhodococcus drewsii AZ1]|uniref:Sulfate transporter/antisigma-factor antagonist STAS n=1 Tax=Thiorhodococcus drewsii AZ1 TaxID=765913 RepID=G2E0H7_9GAMM|nr:STAS domain-containing protein [Thiorhodococcus drewsii]EGV31905.1 Sulfate transporter/antisigma-factor antagonist STAS [Thiorhodococcus drewsii AZ1]